MGTKDILKTINSDFRDFSELEKYIEFRDLNRFRKDFIEKIALLVISAFGIIAALAWDDALHALFYKLFQNLTDMQAKFFYAALVTVLAVVVSIILTKLFIGKDKKEEIKKDEAGNL